MFMFKAPQMKSSISVFQAWQNFHFGGGAERGVMILWSVEIFLIFPYFLRSLVLSYLATRQAARIYQFISINQASFHLWLKKTYYEHDRRRFFRLFRTL